ncbi:hypothetical protein [Streptomyces atratus]
MWQIKLDREGDEIKQWVQMTPIFGSSAPYLPFPAQPGAINIAMSTQCPGTACTEADGDTGFDWESGRNPSMEGQVCVWAAGTRYRPSRPRRRSIRPGRHDGTSPLGPRCGHLRNASFLFMSGTGTPALGKTDFDHMIRLGWLRSPQSIEVQFGTSRAGAVDVALYTTASVDAVIPAHPEVDWAQLRAVEKGRRSPLAALRPAPATA